MILLNLNRSKDNKWILQKNISSASLFKAYIKTLDDLGNNAENGEALKDQLKSNKGYHGRSLTGSLSTLGVRFSEMCFYMFGYKYNHKFIPSPMTIKMLKNPEGFNNHKLMLINLFSMQYPHPYSNTTGFNLHFGRLILKLLIEDKIDKRLYIDEMIWFLPFIHTVSVEGYNELVASIIEYRTKTYSEKLVLFKSVENFENLFANVLHEMNYYFARIFTAFGVFNSVVDRNHNDGKLFRFLHSEETYRNNAIFSRGNFPGYIKLDVTLIDSLQELFKEYSLYDEIIKIDNKTVFTKHELVSDLYEHLPLKYMAIVFPEDNVTNQYLDTVTNMQYMAKYSSLDGKDFEIALKDVFGLFEETITTELISGSGDTDVLCVMENPQKNSIYKFNVEAKSRSSVNNMNVIRGSLYSKITVV